jgi:Uncharacterized protein conserved in bacteria
MTDDIDAVLAQVERLIDTHDLPAAERLLAPWVDAEIPPMRRCLVLIEWGWLHGATGRYDIARSALARAATLAEHLKRTDLLAEALREAGLVERYTGHFAAADAMFARCAVIARAADDHLGLARSLQLRASLAHLTSAFVTARALLVEAAEVAARCVPGPQLDLLIADICRERAISARIAQDFEEARSFLAEAGRRYAALGRRVGLANTERELGAICESLGDAESARRHYKTAFVTYLRCGRRLGAAAAARRLGQIDMGTGVPGPDDLRRAARRFEQSLRLGGGDPTSEVLTRLRQAHLARMLGRLDDADTLLDAAADRVHALGEPPDVARHLSEIDFQRGLVARERGDRAAAIALFRRAIEVIDPAIDPSAASLAHYELAFDLIRQDRVAEAFEHAVTSFWLDEDSGRRLRDAADRRIFYVAHREKYGLALHCAARADDGRTALAIAVAARSEALAAFVRAGARLAPQLHELVNQIALVTAEHGSDSPQLHALYQRLEQQTSRQLRQAITGERADVADILASLPAGGHALVYEAQEEDARICTRIWVPPDGQPRVDQFIIPPAVHEYLDTYRRAEPEAAWRPQDAELADVGEVMIPPALATVLASGANPPLVVSTGGVLAAVPVAALRVNGRYLAEQARLATVPSLALWASLRTRPVRSGVGTLAYFDVDVPGAAREAAAVAAAFPPLCSVDAHGLRSALTDATRYALVVLNAHGAPAAGEDGAGLAHALDLPGAAPLTAADLLTCRLPDAVVMPDCWSGRLAVQAATEPYGLPTAALLAGARWVLVGTVDIGSTPSATVLVRFYRALAEGLAPSAALQSAQLSYLRRRSAVPPGMWAGLTIIGDGHTTRAHRSGSEP